MNDQLIQDHFHLVRIMAGRVKKRMPPYIDFAELESAGTDGLIRASELYDDSSSFKSYAQKKIKFAIYDWIRQNFGTRSKAFKRGISLIQWDSLEGHFSPTPYKGQGWHESEPYVRFEPLSRIMSAETMTLVKKLAGRSLPHKVCEVILDGMYVDGLSQKEIAVKLGYCESRICQMHNTIIKSLKNLSDQGKFDKSALWKS